MDDGDVLEITDWFSEEAATFGDRVAGAREAKGLSQKDLAGRLGIKLKTLRDWEDDLNDPRANKLSMLSGVLNVSIGWLLTGEGEGPDAPGASPDLTPEATELLVELQSVRDQIGGLGRRLAKLEAQLRKHLKA